MESHRTVVLGGMPEVAQYVYQDYHIRIHALSSKVKLAHTVWPLSLLISLNCVMQIGEGSPDLAPPPEAPPTQGSDAPPTEDVDSAMESVDQVAESSEGQTTGGDEMEGGDPLSMEDQPQKERDDKECDVSSEMTT